ncbi:MAG TPA: hypothetical protein PKZ84_10125 [Anaerolineae bacterium]|nr:hypothetical protein [Anaerolineae bacterium]HQI85009.1 hypothetical protein [Anaerolineae bacterium]
MENVQQMILEQVRGISIEVQRIPQILARLDSISEAQHRLEARDDEQAAAITDLKNRDHEFTASFTVLSNEIRQLTRDIDALKQEINPLNMLIPTVNSSSLRIEKLEATALDRERREQVDKTLSEINEWRPLLKGLRWGLLIIGGMLVMAIFSAILWAMGQSGVLTP